jgi:hypothetical protein
VEVSDTVHWAGDVRWAALVGISLNRLPAALLHSAACVEASGPDNIESRLATSERTPSGGISVVALKFACGTLTHLTSDWRSSRHPRSPRLRDRMGSGGAGAPPRRQLNPKRRLTTGRN